MDKLCETINRQCCLHCEMECDGKWLETEIEMYKENLLKKQSDKIADLEAKLAESDAEIERFKEINAVQKNKIINLDKMYKQSQEAQKQLKQQLAEKEKEVQKWKNKKVKYIVDNIIRDRNQTAIDELEKVKTDAEKLFNLDECNLALAIVLSKINQQINDLRSK